MSLTDTVRDCSNFGVPETKEEVPSSVISLPARVEPVKRKIIYRSLGITSPALLHAVRTRHPSLPDLLRALTSPQDITDVLRAATLSPYLAKHLLATRGWRGVPFLPGVCLLPHQVHALGWMQEREASGDSHWLGLKGGMLSMVMGLGKTLTSLVASLAFPNRGTTLVVASKTVLTEWKANIQRFLEGNDEGKKRGVKVLYFHREYLKDLFDEVTPYFLSQYDFVLTTYDVCLGAYAMTDVGKGICVIGDSGIHRGKVIEITKRTLASVEMARAASDVLFRSEWLGAKALYALPWGRIIADESQRFANPKTTTFRAMMGLFGQRCWCLSGTPIRNYDTDLWAQFRFLGFNDPRFRNATSWKKTGGATFYRNSGLHHSVLVMGYEEAGITLPARELKVTALTFTGKSLACYQFVYEQTVEAYRLLLSRKISFACVLALFIRLRQCCIAPFLMLSSRFDPLSSDEMDADQEAVHRLTGHISRDLVPWISDRSGEAGIRSPKITAIVETIQSIPPEEKILVFSMFTASLCLLGHALAEKSIEFEQIDGSVTGKDRERILTQFRADPTLRILLLNYKVGSEGLTLTEARHCLCIEPWWSPAVHRQAEARIWRMGQTMPVTIHRILVRGTIEEHILRICDAKDKLTDDYFEGVGDRAPGLNKNEMAKMLGMFGTDESDGDGWR